MKLLVSFLILCSSTAWAASNDFNVSESDIKPIAVDKLRYQFEIVGRVLVFDQTGQHLVSRTNEDRHWRFSADKPIMSNWSSKTKGLPDVALQHEWNLDRDGGLQVTIRQYSFIEDGKGDTPKFGKLVNEKTFKVENFDSINWVLEQSEARRVVVKFTPNLWSETKPIDLGPLAINSRDMIVYDGKGNVWAQRVDNSEGNNSYFGMTTHKGSVYLSYVPFPGAKQIGTVEKNRIKVEVGTTKLLIQSGEFFVPQGVSGKVYGMIDLGKQTDNLYSVKAYGSDKEGGFLKHIQR